MRAEPISICPPLMITRFAPSPTGPLHLGHAFSAQIAHHMARRHGGRFLLRIEDIDASRACTKWTDAIYRDMTWLGLKWDGVVLHQSTRMRSYQSALDQLAALGLLYPCRCKRSDIQSALSAPQEGAPISGPDGVVYPGTCRGRPLADAGANDVLRLDIEKALQQVDSRHPIDFRERGPICEGRHILDPHHMIRHIGDVALARRNIGTSYHLSVVMDDAHQSITTVTRGVDLFDATPLHRLLQALLDLTVPIYFHHNLVRDETGKRLAKRDDARSIESYRATGATPAEVWSLIEAAGKSSNKP